jgi:glyoxylase-like metal-dependent hydrolase (beta-lactamase superfamily II)
MQEEELGSLGIFRISIPIPFRQAGGPANAYVIEEEDGIMLFDVGIGMEESQAALAQGLARIGYGFKDVNRIVFSHGHIDHYGAAVWALEQIGRTIPVMIHNADAGKVLESGPDLLTLIKGNRQYLSMLGMPLPVLEDLIVAIRREAGLGRRLAEVTPLIPGDKFQCKHVTLEVLHMPGHTPGLCCLYEREHRILFSADHLLERVSPNPLIELRADGEPTFFKPLVSYFESVERVRALPVDLVLPGHATPFTAHCEVIDSLFKFYEQRQSKLLAACERRPLTVYEAMQELFPLGSSFELFLMMSETLGNLEVLENRGKIKRKIKEGSIRFQIYPLPTNAT